MNHDKIVWQMKPTSIEGLVELGQVKPEFRICKENESFSELPTSLLNEMRSYVLNYLSHLGRWDLGGGWLYQNEVFSFSSDDAAKFHVDNFGGSKALILLVGVERSDQIGTEFLSFDEQKSFITQPWYVYFAFGKLKHRGIYKTLGTRFLVRFCTIRGEN